MFILNAGAKLPYQLPLRDLHRARERRRVYPSWHSLHFEINSFSPGFFRTLDNEFAIGNVSLFLISNKLKRNKFYSLVLTPVTTQSPISKKIIQNVKTVRFGEMTLILVWMRQTNYNYTHSPSRSRNQIRNNNNHNKNENKIDTHWRRTRQTENFFFVFFFLFLLHKMHKQWDVTLMHSADFSFTHSRGWFRIRVDFGFDLRRIHFVFRFDFFSSFFNSNVNSIFHFNSSMVFNGTKFVSIIYLTISFDFVTVFIYASVRSFFFAFLFLLFGFEIVQLLFNRSVRFVLRKLFLFSAKIQMSLHVLFTKYFLFLLLLFFAFDKILFFTLLIADVLLSLQENILYTHGVRYRALASSIRMNVYCCVWMCVWIHNLDREKTNKWIRSLWKTKTVW